MYKCFTLYLTCPVARGAAGAGAGDSPPPLRTRTRTESTYHCDVRVVVRRGPPCVISAVVRASTPRSLCSVCFLLGDFAVTGGMTVVLTVSVKKKNRVNGDC